MATMRRATRATSPIRRRRVRRRAASAARAAGIACADAGAPCPGSFATETKDELLQHMQMHTAAAHAARR